MVDQTRERSRRGPSDRSAASQAIVSRLRLIQADQSVVDAVVERAIHAGLFVQLTEPRTAAFLPASESGVARAELRSLVGKRFQVTVIDAAPARGYPVVSRKSLVSAARAERLNDLAVGTECEATVVGVKDFGVFVALDGGFGDALVHRSEIASQVVEDPADFCTLGDRIRVVITNVDLERSRVSASLRQVGVAAWREVAAVYGAGVRAQGRLRVGDGRERWVELAPDVRARVDRPIDVGTVWVDIEVYDPAERTLQVSVAGPADEFGPPRLRSWRPVPVMYSRWAQGGWDPWTAQWWDEQGFTDPDFAAPWQRHFGDPTEARSWADEGFTPDAAITWALADIVPTEAAAWRDMGLGLPDAESWIEHGFSSWMARRWSPMPPSEVGPWLVQDVHPTTAHRLRDVGLAPDEWPEWSAAVSDLEQLVRWFQSSATPEQAAIWAAVGFEPSQAERWQSMLLEPAVAARWVSEDFRPAEASMWSEAGFAPGDARLWADQGIDPLVAELWRRAELEPGEARTWITAGVATPDEARLWQEHFSGSSAAPWIRAGWNDPPVARSWSRKRWTPREAIRALEAGLGPESGSIPKSLAPPRRGKSKERTHTGEDLFGIPKDDRRLESWVSAAAEAPSRAKLHQSLGLPAGVIELQAWSLPARPRPSDVANIGPELGLRLGKLSWETVALHRIARSEPFLFRPQDAALFIEADPLPADIEVRMPFDRITIYFGARFRLADEHVRRVRRQGTTATFEPWLDALRGRGGDLIGVSLRARQQYQLAKDVVWLVVIDDELIPIPGFLDESRLRGPIENLLVGTTQPVVAGRPAPTRRRQAKSGTGRRVSASDVHVVDIRTISDAPAGRSASGDGGPRAAHIRRAHWHRYRIGPRDSWHYELRFILPTYVGGTPPGDDRKRVYRMPSLSLF